MEGKQAGPSPILVASRVRVWRKDLFREMAGRGIPSGQRQV